MSQSVKPQTLVFVSGHDRGPEIKFPGGAPRSAGSVLEIVSLSALPVPLRARSLSNEYIFKKKIRVQNCVYGLLLICAEGQKKNL